MKRLFFPVIFFLFTAHAIVAQTGDLMLKSSDKGLYVDHKVAPKQSFFSIGRMYNVHPNAIASFNKLDIKKGLQIGQQMRIPLTDTNFSQKTNSGTPVYYKVGDNEGLMKVSNANNNVTLANIRHWNGLTSDKLSPGKKLIVGFVQSKELPSITIKGTAKANEEVLVKEEPKKDPPKETEKPVVVKEEPKTEVKEEPKKPEPVFTKTEEKPVGVSSENGYFKYHFDQQVKSNGANKNETVTSGVFKTTSGWLDAKYYLLIDNVQPGTIVKLTNPSNSKVIYAKVLGQMAGIKQNEGLNIRISSAGAAALQVDEQDKFIVKINY